MDKSSDISCLLVDEANAVVSNADYEVIPGSVTVYRNASNDYVLAFENEAEMPRLEHMPYLRRHAFIVIILVLTILVFLINRFLAIRIYRTALYELGVLPATDYRAILKQINNQEEITLEETMLDYAKISEQKFYILPACRD